MNVVGEVWEGFVSIKSRTVSSKNLSFGSMLCKVCASTLKGKYIFRNLAGDASSISVQELNSKRKNA